MLTRFVTWQQASTHYLLLHASQPIQKPCFPITTSQNHLQVKNDKLPLQHFTNLTLEDNNAAAHYLLPCLLPYSYIYDWLKLMPPSFNPRRN